MIILALVIAVFSLVISVFLSLAIMELLANGVAGPRPEAGPDEDNLVELELGEDVLDSHAADHGLALATPAEDGLDLLLVLSPKCTRCGEIADSLPSELPPGLTVLVTAADRPTMEQWAGSHGIAKLPVIYDDEASVVGSLGISGSPSVVAFVAGRVRYAAAVGGLQVVEQLLMSRYQSLEAALRDRHGAAPGANASNVEHQV